MSADIINLKTWLSDLEDKLDKLDIKVSLLVGIVEKHTKRLNAIQGID